MASGKRDKGQEREPAAQEDGGQFDTSTSSPPGNTSALGHVEAARTILGDKLNPTLDEVAAARKLDSVAVLLRK